MMLLPPPPSSPNKLVPSFCTFGMGLCFVPATKHTENLLPASFIKFCKSRPCLPLFLCHPPALELFFPSLTCLPYWYSPKCQVMELQIYLGWKESWRSCSTWSQLGEIPLQPGCGICSQAQEHPSPWAEVRLFSRMKFFFKKSRS